MLILDWSIGYARPSTPLTGTGQGAIKPIFNARKAVPERSRRQKFSLLLLVSIFQLLNINFIHLQHSIHYIP